MKKLFLFFGLIILLMQSSAFALKIYADIDNGEQAKINEIGFRILNANKIPYRTVFFYNNNRKIVNASTNVNSRSVVFYRGLYLCLNSDDEIAAILAHEIAHSVESHNGILDGYFTPFTHSFASKKYEYKADKDGIDYLVKAGYNPLAMITALNKVASQTRFEAFSTHPKTSKRLMTIYEYIYDKYPYFLVNNDYIKNPYYQNFLVTSYKNREKLKNKIETNSNKKIGYE